MAKRLGLFFLFAILAGCSKDQDKAPGRSTFNEGPEHSALSAPTLKNCRFKNSAPQYAFNSSIEPNIILCDEGVPTRVEVLNPNPLPTGLQFSIEQMALTGEAKEKVVNVPYEFYLENPAGYVRIKLTLTVK